MMMMMRQALGAVWTEVWFRGSQQQTVLSLLRRTRSTRRQGDPRRGDGLATSCVESAGWSGKHEPPRSQRASEPANKPVSPRHDISGAPQLPRWAQRRTFDLFVEFR